MGKLILTYGTMNAAKSTNLLTKGYELEAIGFDVIYLKPEIDTRTEDTISTRVRGIQPVHCDLIPKSDYCSLVYFYPIDDFYDLSERKPVHILIDEVQFLSPKFIDSIIEEVTKYDNLTVHCYGLMSDFRGEPFQSTQKLLLYSNEVNKLFSYCECGNEALINARFDNNNKLVTDGEIVQVGDLGTYKPLCPKCFFKLKNKL